MSTVAGTEAILPKEHIGCITSEYGVRSGNCTSMRGTQASAGFNINLVTEQSQNIYSSTTVCQLCIQNRSLGRQQQYWARITAITTVAASLVLSICEEVVESRKIASNTALHADWTLAQRDCVPVSLYCLYHIFFLLEETDRLNFDCQQTIWLHSEPDS